MIVYVNGQWCDDTTATVSFQDRAVVFADAIYEVVHIYNGAFFGMELHVERMQTGLDALRIPLQARDLVPVFAELLARNTGLEYGLMYVQVSRGVAPRLHGIPAIEAPTIFAYAKPHAAQHDKWDNGARALFVEDRRWELCNLKTTGLLLNCLAKGEALDQGYDDAIFHRGQIVTEASSSNVFIVKDGNVLTHPNGPWVLPGITRHMVIELAREHGLAVREVQFTKDDLLLADELFLTGTGSEITPYVAVNGSSIGAGTPGPITRRLQAAYHAAIEAATLTPA